jgi:hypothetical protein
MELKGCSLPDPGLAPRSETNAVGRKGLFREVYAEMRQVFLLRVAMHEEKSTYVSLIKSRETDFRQSVKTTRLAAI